MESNRRQFIVGGGSTLASIAALSAPAAAGTHGSPQSADSDSHDYPVLGADADAPVLTVFGSFNCPYTAKFVENSFDDIVEEFVEPGRLTLEFRALEYEADGGYWISQNGVQAGQAATGVWERDADSYWDFFAELWSHMPGQVDADSLEGFLQDAGVEGASAIADDLDSWDGELRTTARVADETGVEYTPTLELKGDLGNRHDVIDWIEHRLDGEGGDGAEETDTADDADTQDEANAADDADTENEENAGDEATQDEASTGDDSERGGGATSSDGEETTGGADESADADAATDDETGQADDVQFCPF